MKKLKLDGKKFGLWKVIKFVEKRKKGSYWLCRCKCGIEKVLRGSSLKRKETLSCGSCIKKGNKHPLWKGYGEISGYLWRKITDSAKARNIKFDIDLKYIWKIYLKQNRKCALSGEQIKFGSRYLGIETTASLDRKDSKKGYVKNNVQWIHKSVNNIKTDMDESEFIRWCKLISLNMEAEK